MAGKQTTLEIKAMLGAAYNADTGLMNDSLRVAGLLPVKEPYTGMGYHFTTGLPAQAGGSGRRRDSCTKVWYSSYLLS